MTLTARRPVAGWMPAWNRHRPVAERKRAITRLMPVPSAPPTLDAVFPAVPRVRGHPRAGRAGPVAGSRRASHRVGTWPGRARQRTAGDRRPARSCSGARAGLHPRRPLLRCDRRARMPAQHSRYGPNNHPGPKGFARALHRPGQAHAGGPAPASGAPATAGSPAGPSARPAVSTGGPDPAARERHPGRSGGADLHRRPAARSTPGAARSRVRGAAPPGPCYRTPPTRVAARRPLVAYPALERRLRLKFPVPGPGLREPSSVHSARAAEATPPPPARRVAPWEQ